MIPHVVEAKHIRGYKLWLQFNDGLSGEIDLYDEPQRTEHRQQPFCVGNLYSLQMLSELGTDWKIARNLLAERETIFWII